MGNCQWIIFILDYSSLDMIKKGTKKRFYSLVLSVFIVDFII